MVRDAGSERPQTEWQLHMLGENREHPSEVLAFEGLRREQRSPMEGVQRRGERNEGDRKTEQRLASFSKAGLGGRPSLPLDIAMDDVQAMQVFNS